MKIFVILIGHPPIHPIFSYFVGSIPPPDSPSIRCKKRSRPSFLHKTRVGLAWENKRSELRKDSIHRPAESQNTGQGTPIAHLFWFLAEHLKEPCTKLQWTQVFLIGGIHNASPRVRERLDRSCPSRPWEIERGRSLKGEGLFLKILAEDEGWLF